LAENDSYSYIGRKTCGCIVTAFVDNPEHKKDLGNEIARWIKEGLKVERVTCQYVRDNMKKCKHKGADEVDKGITASSQKTLDFSEKEEKKFCRKGLKEIKRL